MSYILEALKKIEQKKEQEELPKSVTFAGNGTEAMKKHAVWPYVLIAVLLINALFLLHWSLSPSPSEKSPAIPPTAPPQATTSPSKSAPAAEHARIEQKSTPARRIDKSEPKRSGPDNEPPRRPTLGDVQRPSGSEQGVPVAVVPPRPGHPVEKPASVSGKIYGLSELPEELKGSLPEFRISGHAYSPEPQTRVVRINEKILQEGQDLSPGLRVEEIVPTGVILSYRGYRFRVDLGQSRS